MHAPEVTDFVKLKAAQVEAIGDEIDHVNQIKYDEASKFDAEKDKDNFRRYEDACDRVKGFYKEQHTKQTLNYNLAIREKYAKNVNARMTVWEAMEMLNTLIDESDPDTSVGQIEHLLQTAEAIRRDGKPEWMQVVGLVHDLGKLLCFFGADGQWDVVGDTFVVGCEFSDKIIYGKDSFVDNPDIHDEKLMTECGIYERGCGLDNVLLSYGHDEYLYDVMRRQSKLPKEGLSMIRYHSFYPWHKENAYQHLMCEDDKAQLAAVRAFNPYDLYSKSDEPPKVSELKPYYQGLIDKWIPGEIVW
ncbi:myo-inositol oxygenase [Kockovaella imperatae]|uniref:Inositol oxygenase n=1 Tax=Kockovaella imperatae TaxID=4999 RepID=A0A1Y1UN94_9TREE|nr:myo-inositol oxygenase [Kockovaella imperatae]ORX38954.1 myo-inositol oxygenase [Kockovaella imperatae]